MMPSGICAICFIPMFPFPHCLSPHLLFLPSSSFPSFSQLVPTLVFICVYPCLYVCAHVGICGCAHGLVSGTQCVSGDQKTTLGCLSPCLAPCLDKLAYLALFFFLLYMPGQLAHGSGTLLTLPLIPRKRNTVIVDEGCCIRLSSRPGTRAASGYLNLGPCAYESSAYILSRLPRSPTSTLLPHVFSYLIFCLL